MERAILTEKIKAEAFRLGFSACGIAPAGFTDKDARYFEEWLSAGKHAGMKFMENYFEKRVDPRLLMEDTASVVSLALNYYPEKRLPDGRYQFAWYAYGKDYHEVMKSKLRLLLEYIGSLIPVSGKICCDTAPVLERYWAWRAGIGWIGKNTQLIIPHAGSCFFLGELLIDAALTYDVPQSSRCGSCTRCLDGCPTAALEEPYRLDCNKCLSYLTIENRGEIPPQFARKMGNRVYGCDECQKVCPWNRFAVPTSVEEFKPSPGFMNAGPHFWNQLTPEEYRTMFKGSAVKRATFDGLKRNIRIAAGQQNKDNKECR